MSQGIILARGRETLQGHALEYALFHARGEYGIAAILDGKEYAVLRDIGRKEELVRSMYDKVAAGCVFPHNLAEVVYELLLKAESP